jgi:oleate hydratase
MQKNSKAYLFGGGIGSLAAAAFMIRDGNVTGPNISILEMDPVMGGSLDGAGDPTAGYSMRGGRMLTTDNYECTWDLYKSIPSLNQEGKSVFEETIAFNEEPNRMRWRGWWTNAAPRSLWLRWVSPCRTAWNY